MTSSTQVYKIRAEKKAQSVLADPSHPLFRDFRLLPSGCRYNLMRCRTNRFKNSLVLAAVGLLNNIMYFCVLFFFCVQIVCVLIGVIIVLLLAVQQIAPWG